MARPTRRSKPGRIQHTIIRGIAQRLLFENAGDYHFYEHLYEKVYGHDEAEVRLYGYCLMPNHVHEIVSGALDAISKSMKSVHQQYTQWFNKKRGRDGPMFSQRFFSRPVELGVNFQRTLSYIDQNPQKAGLVAHAGAYAWGSAASYLRNSLPTWLDPRGVDVHLNRELEAGLTPAHAYLVKFGGVMTKTQFRDMEARIRKDCSSRRTADSQLEYNSPDSLNWFEGRARLADGMSMLCRSLVLPSELEELIRKIVRDAGLLKLATRPLRGGRCYLDVLRATLFQAVCRLGVGEIAEQIGVSPGTASKRLKRHTQLLGEQAEYRRLFEKVFEQLIVVVTRR